MARLDSLLIRARPLLSSQFYPTLSLLSVVAVAGCTPPTTPPESSPVYAEEIAPGAKPITIERSSLNDPESEVVAGPTAATKQSSDAPEANTGDDAQPPQANPEGAVVPPTEAQPSAPASDEATQPDAPPPQAPTNQSPGNQPQPAQSPKKKTSSAKEAESGCGAGSCG